MSMLPICKCDDGDGDDDGDDDDTISVQNSGVCIKQSQYDILYFDLSWVSSLTGGGSLSGLNYPFQRLKLDEGFPLSQ